MRVVPLCLLALLFSSADASPRGSPDQHVRAALLALEHLDSLKLLPASWRPATFVVQAGGSVPESRSRRLEEAIPVAEELRVRGPVPLVRCSESSCEAIERDFIPVSVALREPPYTGLEAGTDDLVIAVSIPDDLQPGHAIRMIGFGTLCVRISDIGGANPTASVIRRVAADHWLRPRK